MNCVDFYKQFQDFPIVSPLLKEDGNPLQDGIASSETYELGKKLWSREITSWEEVFSVIGDRISSPTYMSNLYSDLYVHPEEEKNATFFYKAVYDFVEEVLYGSEKEIEDWRL